MHDASWVQIHKSGLDRIIIAKGVVRVITAIVWILSVAQLQMRLAEGIRLKHAMSSWESHSCEFFGGGGVVVVLIMVAIHQRAWGWLEPGTCFTQHIHQNSKLLKCNRM